MAKALVAVTGCVFVMVAFTRHAQATEVCGNGIDDDNPPNGLVDEGCYPQITTNQCVSPLNCEEGMVGPSTGSLRYALAPDVAPKVPYGLPLSFQRFYVSMYAPGGGAPAYRKPLGDRWGHNYMSWLDKYTAPSPDEIVIHLPRGHDAMFKYTGTANGFHEYNTFQPGFHFASLKERTSSPNEFQLRALTGETLVYNSSGKLIELWDTLATPNKTLLTYDGSGMLSTVTDASDTRRLLFAYTSSQITSVKFQIKVSGSWQDKHTTTYAYSGSHLTTVTIGGQLAHTNVYTSNYLTQIQDGEGNALMNFVYDGTTAGKVVRLDSPRGVVGYEFGSSRSNCSSKTVLAYHRTSTSSCSVDSDCGTGNLCSGKTGAGSTGQCFRAARCLTVSSPSDDVVTTMSAFAGSSESCDGACLDATEHIWNTGSGALDLAATKDATGSNYTTREFNSNGLVTKIVYGDNDSSSSSGGLREVFFKYDNSSFPGRVTEIRRKSSIKSGTCNAGTDAACVKTQYAFNGDGKLSTMEVIGYTSNSSTVDGGDIRSLTTYSYNSLGQLTQIDGPLSGSDDKIVFEYFSGTGEVLKDNFVQTVKRYVDASNYLTNKTQDHDFWGNATTVLDTNDVLTCLTFDAARGYLKERRRTMAGQGSCSTADSSDLMTSWEQDSALRTTKLTRPDGGCLIFEYDSRGRLSKTKRRDDCNGASSGDKQEFTYSADGLLTKIETFDSSSTVTKRQEMTYFDSRRLEKLINPVDTSKATTMAYDPRGMVNQVIGGGSLNKTEWTFDAEGRIDKEKRFTAGSSTDDWTLTFDWSGGQYTVQDGDSKTTTSTRDDLGRVVQLANPDLGGYPTLRVYNDASHLTTIKERFGGSGVQTHTFTYDKLGRLLEADYSGTCHNGDSNVPDIVRVYDAPPGGSCPSGVTCANLKGRLAYVKVKLMCSGTAGDDGDYTLEQETFFSYDPGGRMIREYIRDDAASGASQRIADHFYEWSKSGVLTKTTLPSGAVLGATLGSGGSNSDTDKITALWRTNTSTPIINNIAWFPYGGLQSYDQQNTASSNPLATKITRDLAYRITKSQVWRPAIGDNFHQVEAFRDSAGRVYKRDYYPEHPNVPGVYDSYFIYDLQDHVLCETTSNVGSCPTSGSNIKNSHTASPPFTHAGDWKTLLRPISGSTGLTHAFTLTSGTHQIASVNQSDGTPTLGTTALSYDDRGNRSSDDNTSGLTHDGRTYSYDARRNVINVRGEYYNGGAWHYYDVASAFDAQNRRVYKSFYDESTAKLATWFFYYDALNRLAEVRYTPDTSSATTYTVFQLVWLDDRLVLYWQTDYPSAVTSKRYVGTDETGRPLDMWTWPSSGNAARAWAVAPDAWGHDKNAVGPTVFQPILFAGQYRDDETLALWDDHATVHRPGLVLNGYRTYDAFVGSYLQVDPLVERTWSTYGYVNSNPVGRTDPLGREQVDHSTITVREWDWNAGPGYGCEYGLQIEGGGCATDPGDPSSWYDFTWIDCLLTGDCGPTSIDCGRNPRCREENPKFNGCLCRVCTQTCQHHADIKCAEVGGCSKFELAMKVAECLQIARPGSPDGTGGGATCLELCDCRAINEPGPLVNVE